MSTKAITKKVAQQHRSTQSCQAQTSRRAFVLPLVIMLSIIFSLMATVMFQRQSVARLRLTRQLAAYQEHHAARGLQEIVGVWLTTLRGAPLNDLLEDDGFAFELTMPDRSTARVYFFDAQSLVLSNWQALGEEQAAEAAGVYEQIRKVLAPGELAKLSRPFGPVAVSVNSAGERVLRAVAGFALQTADENQQNTVVDEIIRARNRGELQRGTIAQIVVRQGIENQDRIRFTRLLTINPTLWKIRVDLHTSMGSKLHPDVRYEGLTEISGASSGVTSGAQVGTFYNWGKVDSQ